MNKDEVKEAMTPKVDQMYDPLGAMNEMLDAASELFKFEPSKKKLKKKKNKKSKEVYVEPQKVYYDVPEQKSRSSYPVTYGTSSL